MLVYTPQTIQVCIYHYVSLVPAQVLCISSFVAGPTIPSPVEYRLLSHPYAYPPIFTVTCISTTFPPTTLEWRLNGSPLDLSSNTFSSSQQLRDAASSTYHNILTVSGASVGQYSCSVSNDRGANAANITVNGRKFTFSIIFH